MEKIIKDYLKTSDGKNVFLLSSDFRKTNFEQLLKEYTQKKCVAWEIKGKGSTKMQKGDICYIKYTHLPFPDNNEHSRILLRGIVCEEAHIIKKSDIYFHDDKNTNEETKGFRIEHLQPIRLTDNIKYSKENLKKQYDLSTNVQSIQQLYDDSKHLYEDIENDINTNEELKDLIDYFNTPCFFEKYLHKNSPLTFKCRSTNIFYYERHHFIQQYKGREINNYKFTSIIDDPENIISMCPLCHRRIHHGTAEDVSEMIDLLYNAKKGFLEEKNIEDFIGNDTDVLQWIKESYKVNFDEYNSKDYTKTGNN